jgi:hypothetical protein
MSGFGSVAFVGCGSMRFLITGTDRLGRIVLRRDTAAAAREKAAELAAGGCLDISITAPDGHQYPPQAFDLLPMDDAATQSNWARASTDLPEEESYASQVRGSSRRTNADRYRRFACTGSKQTHAKAMLQFTNMLHGLHEVGDQSEMRKSVPAASKRLASLQITVHDDLQQYSAGPMKAPRLVLPLISAAPCGGN